ncbi:aromatic ring-hydroxylating dioxygenase subunit alpha [Pseudomonas corrugata]|uniref:Aromatic ring-hydroxylating dioxygenase subunit alpha n=1 Tax=Pseudomonas corrugata TaxID=47879 RepID=A0A8B6UX23_9PSED|nr:aromatic ring-hydroxylating dioxygenase subunit alpha [Pseudomonas corrugata]MDU9025727.1 aromatic ring-hydroxylating dioxygenase subunit alpha [Pseudomonas corrugata]MDU9035646.1 aromatic ring-hydroxylating dioxygenase subunit alpha [Pseudomonas corrugata]MDU9040453.1 aromatic ring-hydroxylating dioxygenase subunit alpha [Pseudomonas corrugata]QTH16450.1 aromatic ring-hydroxylating dioxygenase subunit alpha [Pseudomonas corrugata]UZD97861.1 aromatic ring-hydroxylating dioxygenase subunit a
MTINAVKTHRELLTDRTPGHGMPGDLFGRPDIFETDVDIFFTKHWILVGVTSDIPEPGDVSTLDIGKSSILLVRDDDEHVQAFRNVCRHRGARLKQAGKSTVGMLVCPYHQWSYDLDGSLKHAAHMGKDFDSKCKSLIPVHTRVIGTHVFVCLGDEPPEDIMYLEQVMTPRFAQYDIAHSKIAYESEIIENGNWKLVIENNRECYHCAATHPELTASFLPEDFGFCTDGLGEDSLQALAEYHQRNADTKANWESEGYICDAVEHLGEDAVTQFRSQRLAIAGNGESQTLDTRVACTRLFGDLTRRDLGDMHLWTHNSWTHVMSDHAVVSYIIPLAPDKTLVRTKWLVHADAVEGVDYQVDKLTEVWVATNLQDANLVGITHSGTQDPSYTPGPFSAFTEAYVDQFSRWYAARLAAHGV